MLSRSKTGIMILAGMMFTCRLFAQIPDSIYYPGYFIKPFSNESAFRTWSVGAGVGLLTPYTMISSNPRQDFTSPGSQLGYSVYVQKQILPSFGFQLNYFGGQLQGDHSQPNSSGVSRYTQFNTQLHYAISFNGILTLANVNWRHQSGVIQPYLIAGGGFMGYKPVLHHTDGTVADYKPTNNGNIGEFFIPAGLGVKFDIARGVNLDIGYQVNFVFSDNLDGFDYGSTNDRFSYIHAGLEFALGPKSKPQLSVYNPVVAMRTEYLTAAQRLNNAVVDQQTQIDRIKAKNDQLRSDLSTVNVTLAKLTTDSDNDGVPDFYDKCPNTPPDTKVDGSGCPLPVNKPDVKVYITESDKKIVKDAINDLEFESGNAIISPASYPSLDKVAQLLIDKNFSLKLAGHTDNIGNADANMRLSKERAEAVKGYLVSKGANPSRIEATGYGETQPIASNRTAEGRRKNRRVEFTLY